MSEPAKRLTTLKQTKEQLIPRLIYYINKNRPVAVNFTLPVNAWATDSNGYYADINIVGVTANDYAEIDFDSTSQNIVFEANISVEGNSMTDKLRIFAKNIPTGTITGTAKITKN